MGEDKLGVVDGSELSINSVYVGPGAGDSIVPGLGLMGVIPQRRVFFSSPAWSSDSGEVLSGLAYDPAREHFFAVRSSQPRSVYLLRWDGTGATPRPANNMDRALGHASMLTTPQLRKTVFRRGGNRAQEKGESRQQGTKGRKQGTGEGKLRGEERRR